MATYQNSRYNIALPSGSGGAIVPIKTLTASSSGTLSFVNGSSDVVLDNTYRTYIFKWINIHPETDNQNLTVGFRDGSTNYDATKTTTFFYAYQGESSGTSALDYVTGSDLAQATGFQQLTGSVGNGNDESCAGELWLFNPSSTTYVKNFISKASVYEGSNYAMEVNVGGYCSVTAAIDAVQFKMSSGDIDAGTIKLYGIT